MPFKKDFSPLLKISFGFLNCFRGGVDRKSRGSVISLAMRLLQLGQPPKSSAAPRSYETVPVFFASSAFS